MGARRIELEGCFNFRDLGGWRTESGGSVRWGRLFRADSVHLMTERDVECARQELGVRTLFDLRNDIEIEVSGLGALAETGTARHHLPLSRRRGAIDASAGVVQSADRSPETMVDNYLGVLEASGDLIVHAVETIAGEEALPAVFFCAAGKDRTGVLSAVVLGALGVRDEDIVEDYVLSAETIGRVIGRFAQTPGAADMYRDLPADNFAPVAETMERVIEGVRGRYGSFATYLTAKGLPDGTVEQLRTALLEPA